MNYQKIILLVIGVFILSGCARTNFSGWENNGSLITTNLDVDVNGTVTAILFIGNGSNISGIEITVTQLNLTGNITSVWNSSGNVIFLNDSTGGIKIENLFDVGGSNFFDLVGKGAGKTVDSIDSTGQVDFIDIEITESQISDLAHTAPGAGGTGDHPINASGLSYFLNDTGAILGIGTANPVEDLTVQGNGSISGDLRVEGNLLGLFGSSGDVGVSSGWTDDGAVVRLTDASDNVGIGTASPSEKLEVAGNIAVTGDLVAT